MPSTPTTDLDPFETKLLAELRAVVTEQARTAGTEEPVLGSRAVRQWSPRRTGLLAAAAMVGAAGAVAVPLLTTGGSAAYAVETQDDGTVTVTVERFEDAPGLQQALRGAGINAYVDYAPTGMACEEPRYTPSGGTTPIVELNLPAGSPEPGESQVRMVVRPDLIGEGRSLVVSHQDLNAGGTERAITVDVAEGPVAPCALVPASGGS